MGVACYQMVRGPIQKCTDPGLPEAGCVCTQGVERNFGEVSAGGFGKEGRSKHPKPYT